MKKNIYISFVIMISKKVNKHLLFLVNNCKKKSKIRLDFFDSFIIRKKGVVIIIINKSHDFELIEITIYKYARKKEAV